MKSFNDKNKYINIYNKPTIRLTDLPKDAVISILYREKGLIHPVQTLAVSGSTAVIVTDDLLPLIDKGLTVEVHYNKEDENGEILRAATTFFLENKKPFVTDLTENLEKDKFGPEYEALQNEYESLHDSFIDLQQRYIEADEENEALIRKHKKEIAAKNKEIKALEDRIAELESAAGEE